MKKNYEMDMCSGPILGKLLTFTIPLIFSGIHSFCSTQRT